MEKRKIKPDRVDPGLFDTERFVTVGKETFIMHEDDISDGLIEVHLLSVQGDRVNIEIPCSESPIPRMVISVGALQ